MMIGIKSIYYGRMDIWDRQVVGRDGHAAAERLQVEVGGADGGR